MLGKVKKHFISQWSPGNCTFNTSTDISGCRPSSLRCNDTNNRMLGCMRLDLVFLISVVTIRRRHLPYIEGEHLALSYVAPKTLYSSPPGWYVGEAEGDIALRCCFCCCSQEATKQNCYSQLIWASGQIGGNAPNQFPYSFSIIMLSFAYETNTARAGKHSTLPLQELWTQTLTYVPIYAHTHAYV